MSELRSGGESYDPKRPGLSLCTLYLFEESFYGKATEQSELNFSHSRGVAEHVG